MDNQKVMNIHEIPQIRENAWNSWYSMKILELAGNFKIWLGVYHSFIWVLESVTRLRVDQHPVPQMKSLPLQIYP